MVGHPIRNKFWEHLPFGWGEKIGPQMWKGKSKFRLRKKFKIKDPNKLKEPIWGLFQSKGR